VTKRKTKTKARGNGSTRRRDDTACFRLPADLKKQIRAVADHESRTLSSTLELLLRRGVADFERDGLLIVHVRH